MGKTDTITTSEPSKILVRMSGCYLTFDVTSRGTLFMHWSHTAVPGALAFFSPRKNVPAFKFRDLGGRQEIIRDFQGPNIKTYYQGICMFMKQAREFDGNVVFYKYVTDAGGPYQVYLCEKGNDKVSELKEGVEVNLKNYAAAGVIPKGSSAFQGTQVANSGFFRETAAKIGGGIAFTA